MKPLHMSIRQMRMALFTLFFVFIFSTSGFAVNVISGFVFDKSGVALPDIDVELLDEYQRTVPNGRQRTSSSGRYEFQVQNSGRYFVKAYAFQYDLLDEMMEVNVANVTATSVSGGSSYNNVDIYLQPKKGGLRDAELAVVFAQDIPKEAREAFEQGEKLLARKQYTQGYEMVRKAIEIFPKYFKANYRYGLELMAKKQYEDAASRFMMAVSVNDKSAMSFYNLAYCFSMMGPEYRKAALASIKETIVMAPASSGAHFLAGKLARLTKDFVNAEKYLLQAKKLMTATDPTIHLELAKLYSDDLKKYKEAAAEMEAFIKTSKITGDEETKMRSILAGLKEKAANQTAN
jgi:tetratricopeptide (TPR) repeat protein